MGFYIGGGLPGPFSWSMRVTPRVRPPRRRPVSRSSYSRQPSRPAARYYTQPPAARPALRSQADAEQEPDTPLWQVTLWMALAMLALWAYIIVS